MSSALGCSVVGGRRDHDDDLAARLGAGRVVARERGKIAAPHFLVQLGQLAADRGLARAEAGREIGERAARRGPLSNSTSVAGMRASSAMRVRRAACLRRQEAFEEEPVGRQAGDRQRRQHRRGAGQRR